MPLISLVVPCYNHAATLARSVASAVAQSHLLELIVVDDRSTDGSLALARELAAGDERIRVLQTERNAGPGAARNVGALAARGELLSFLDADDELIGDFFQDAAEFLSGNPEVKVVKAETEFFDPVKGYVLPDFDPRHAVAILSSSCGLVMSRACFVKMGGFAEDPAFRGPHGGEDVAFMQAIIKHFQPIGRIGRPSYRVWSQQGSHLDRFLGNTRLEADGFEFVRIHPDQAPDGPLSLAIDRYLARVAERLEARH